MQIFFRPLDHRSPEQPRRRPHLCGLLLATLLLVSLASAAQTLARPGWAGSGLTSQAWWQSALLYRVQPQSFQDSNGDGEGDLRGLAQRLDYLQSIGVDAALLESHATDAGFDDLLSEASRHHIRILVQLAEADPAHPPTAQQEIDEARMWLRRGVAGIYLPISVLHSIATRASFNDEVFLLHELRAQTDSFPGERVFITGDTPTVEAAAHGASHGAGKDGPQLVEGLISTSAWDASALRLKLAMADAPAAGEPLLEIARQPAVAVHSRGEAMGREKILAALLLSARGAMALSYGQEIGLAAATPAPVMQWTPTNLTRPQPAATETTVPQVHYGAYHPYVRPAPSSVMGRQPNLPKVALDTEDLPPPVDPDTLPGFSTRAAPAPTANAAAALTNVAVEDTNTDSLLNFYRHVLELHSGNATLRTGSVSFLNHDGEDAVVWLRRAPAGARTVASVIVVCNLSERPVVLSLDDDLARLHVRPGFLRPLLTSTHIDHVAQPTSRITLSPHSVFVGELYHYGAYR
jgi:alpha-glucosidase